MRRDTIMIYNGSGMSFTYHEAKYGGTEIAFEGVAAALTLRDVIDGWIAAQESDPGLPSPPLRFELPSAEHDEYPNAGFPHDCRGLAPGEW